MVECECYLEGLLLVEVVVALHVLGLAVRLRLDDTLHVRRPPEPRIKSYIITSRNKPEEKK
jgi:predicted RNA-binding protein